MEAKKIYVAMPQPDVYYGVKVDKDTKLEFKNDFVTQRVENLTLYTTQKFEEEGFKGYSETEVQLQDGELILLEEEKRGYFRTKIRFGSIDEAIEEMNFLKGQIDKCEV